MTYSIAFRDSRFRIRGTAKPAALSSLKQLVADKDFLDDDAEPVRDRVLDAITLDRALNAFGWDTQTDAEGNVDHLWLTSDELGCSQDMFRILVPFVEPGSYVELIGEDRDIWRWTSTGTHMIETYPDLAWPRTAARRASTALRRVHSCFATLRARLRAAS